MGAEVDMVSTVVATATTITTTTTSTPTETTPSESPQLDSASSTTTATPAPIATPTSTPLNDLTSNNKSDIPSKKKRMIIKGKFPMTMTSTGRQDVIQLKQQLADALGENGPLYWDSLKDFVAGKLNRQEFDFYANLYLSQENAYLHNAFILTTVHNAQTATPPPSKYRSVGWAKRKRGKDNGLLDGENDRDPLKKKLKMDVMSLSKADRERLKTLVKAGDKDKLKPFVDKVLKPRISRVPSLPLPADQLPPTFNSDYARGLLAPLCSDLKELPGPETLHARMTSIALEQGLVKGVSEDVVSAMLFATESYIKSAIANAVSKRRINRSIGLRMEKDTPETRSSALEQILSAKPLVPFESRNQPSSSKAVSEVPVITTTTVATATTTTTSASKTRMASSLSTVVTAADDENDDDEENEEEEEQIQSPSLESNDDEDDDEESIKSHNSSSSSSQSTPNILNDIASLSSSSSLATPTDSISLHDLAFSFSVSPYVLVENPLNAERLTALLTDSEDELTDDELGDTSSEGEFDI
ncbi:transcriptional regulator of RNA polII, SAGA, subunit-domain-containing protein [Phascolomyces articulosus]|uniref:Transcriptional regulator of RNA polII, SAGA, subunit-domain-containing protein n=1 Tax=Phascolomyces articulosus TaxID=60185 RepID=A0AAD5KKK5_9FUNG|nr:transcriptional regulator of RNA polII, SAGA, subunit-domain-containing protein [Phascolomyces articulosus]